MKRLLLVLTFILSTPLFPQNKNYTFSELRGMEDKNGNTHLFYMLYCYYQDTDLVETDNDIYHLDLLKKNDSLFFPSAGKTINSNTFYNIVNDYDFWQNDPTKFIYSGIWWYNNEGGSFIRKYADNPYNQIIFYSGMGNSIEISNQNDSLLFAGMPHLILSSDGGKKWSIINPNENFNFVSLSPLNDNILFASDTHNNLLKSIDRGVHFRIVDSFNYNYNNHQKFLYDSDSIHIYYISDQKLFISNNKGDSASWAKKYSSTNNLYLAIDDSVSGTIYLADGNKILLSTDYGNTFNVYKTLDSAIVGIYKKPNSDILYAATKYDIFEITSSTIKSIKHLITALDDKCNKVPNEFILYQNYPNPFNPTTTIKYSIPSSNSPLKGGAGASLEKAEPWRSGFVKLKVYDILGREVAALVNEYQTAGEHSVQFNTAANPQLTSGIYFYQLKTGDYVSVKKMILIK